MSEEEPDAYVEPTGKVVHLVTGKRCGPGSGMPLDYARHLQ